MGQFQPCLLIGNSDIPQQVGISSFFGWGSFSKAIFAEIVLQLRVCQQLCLNSFLKHCHILLSESFFIQKFFNFLANKVLKIKLAHHCLLLDGFGAKLLEDVGYQYVFQVRFLSLSILVPLAQRLFSPIVGLPQMKSMKT